MGMMIGKPLSAFGLALLCAVVTGCGPREYTGERRFPLSGKVTVDGQLLPHGLIRFMPEGQANRVAGGPITDGNYSIPEANGANAGKYRVEIRWNKPTGRRVKDAYGDEIMDEYKEGLPEKYHANSELTAEVSASRTTFDFDLTTK
jgi:hypothetical protein